MIYVYDLIVPPNTPKFTPVRAELKPNVGILTGVEVYFRDGCLDAVGVRIMEGDRQFAPMPTGSWLKGNNQTFAWSENRHLEGAPYIIIVEGYSDAIDWEHTISFKFYMEHG